MSFYTVPGSFGTIVGEVDTDDNYVPLRIRVEIDSASVLTGNEARDTHLKSPEFFDVANHPKIKFESTQIITKAPEFRWADLFSGQKRKPKYTAVGTLTMRGTGQPVELEFEIPTVPVVDLWQATRLGAQAQTNIDRTQWGLNWNQQVPSLNNALLVGHQVKITINTQLTLVK